MEKKIREIYKCNPVANTEEGSLPKWYNEVIEKRVYELTELDVARCIRQNIFVETATEALLAFLLANPLAGDMYEGELLEKAGMVDWGIMKQYAVSIQEILTKADELALSYEWMDEEDRDEFVDSIKRLRQNL